MNIVRKETLKKKKKRVDSQIPFGFLHFTETLFIQQHKYYKMLLEKKRKIQGICYMLTEMIISQSDLLFNGDNINII